MSDLKHDPEFPYAIVFNGHVIAKFPAEGMGKVNAIQYAADVYDSELVDTTPKPKIPADADYLIWEFNGETGMAYRDGGEWYGAVEWWTGEEMAENLKFAEVTVLVRKEES